MELAGHECLIQFLAHGFKCSSSESIKNANKYFFIMLF